MPQRNTHDVTLTFDDGVEQTLPVAEGQTILDAAIAADAPVLYQCQSGTCTSCIAKLTDGDASMRSGSASSLMKSEQDAGQRLLCLSEVRSDCRFALDYRSTIAGGEPSKVSAFIDSIEHVADDVVALKLELSEGDWLDFQPGQYVQVTLPGADVVRRYSMSSAPAEVPKIELLIRILPDGIMSDYLMERAKADDVLKLEGPYGSFFLRAERKTPLIMIAGGTGLAPMMSMLDTIRAKPGIKPDILLSFGCATPDSLFHQEALELRRLWMPKLDFRISVDSGEAADGIVIGNPVKAVTADDITNPDTQAYLCGPPGLITAARDHLEAIGVKPDNIHSEQFVASE